MYVDPLAGINPDFKSTLAEIPEGRAGVLATLNIMRAIKNQYKKIPAIRNVALRLVSVLPQKSFTQQVRVLHEFVRDKIRYVHDVRGVETLQTPDVTLRLQAGDCDDKSILLATLLESIGHPARYVAIGVQPDRYAHVFVETRIGQKWVALDPTEPHPAGWRPNYRNGPTPLRA